MTDIFVLVSMKKASVIVPACTECNSTAGAKVFSTISDKRKYIHSAYQKKYAKILLSPDWSESELEELGPTMRTHVVTAQNGKKLLKQRLAWPRIT